MKFHLDDKLKKHMKDENKQDLVLDIRLCNT